MTSTNGHGPALAAAERALARIGEPDDQRVWIARVPAATLRERARRLDAAAANGEPLPLLGTTFAVKDNLDVAGLPTTAACPAYAYEPARSATVVARLEAAGALLVGKTNLDQFATGVVGTRSPYGAPSAVGEPQRISGGSSSGSAVAVARGEVDFALGTDTAGSGRVPAAFNRLIGTKPSRGLLSTSGLLPACRSLDCVSIFTRDAQLARAVLDVADEHDPADAYSRPDRAPRGGGALPPRLAIPALAALEPLDAPSRAAWEATLARAAERGATLTEVEIEPLLAAGRLLYDGPWVAERFAAVGAFVKAAAGESGPAADALDPSVRQIVLAAERWSAAEAYDAQERLAALKPAAAELLNAADALLLPTTSHHPTHAEVAVDPIGVNASLGRFTTFVNLLDLAAVALPGERRPDGLPFGVQLIAPALTDRWLLELAAWWGEEPPLPAPGDPLVAVAGAHLRGQPLNHRLLALGGRFAAQTRTAPVYRAYELAGTPARPGLVRSADADDPHAAAIEVELWRLPHAGLGGLLTEIAPPLGLGTVELEDGSSAIGFLCEPHGVVGRPEFTQLGGWRAWLDRREAPHG